MPYTPIIIPADLKTHNYQENTVEITREDESIVESAIATAIAEVSAYLSKYDRKALFGSIPDDTAATFSDPSLTSIVKNVAMWELINLGNPNMNYDHVRTRYEDAIATLKLIQKGQSNPEWPYQDTSTLPTPPDADGVTIYSEPKRTNHW